LPEKSLENAGVELQGRAVPRTAPLDGEASGANSAAASKGRCWGHLGAGVQEAVEPESVVPTDGWGEDNPLDRLGYVRENAEAGNHLLPR
jgi:hypothetical protein